MTAKEWLGNNELSLDIWNNKYRYNNETFDEWLDRVSGGNIRIRRLIEEKKFIFGGRILANRGLEKLGRKITLSNCYVIPPPEDNLESIFECGAQLARTYSYGGGCGIDVSKLRPKGATVNNAAKSTSGTTSFMELFSFITGLIGQEGRRGALMISIDCTHPDLEEFINLKTDLNVCTKANISVKVTDEFMEAVIKDKPWTLELVHSSGSETKVVNAREIFKLLAKRNWEMAEPGILYWDRISNYNLLDHDPNFEYAGVNPCAEEPLPAGGSCLLGSINLSAFVTNPFQLDAGFDYPALKEAVQIAVRGLNEVLMEGLPLHPLQIQRESVDNWRQIGLGTMGLGDMFIKLGVIYGSPESLYWIDNIFSYIARIAIVESLKMAKEKEAYPMCDPEAIVKSNFINALGFRPDIIEDIRTYGLYNSQLLTCAPTGSIGTMLQISTGVEPVYALSYNRKTVSLNDKETTYKVEAEIVRQYREATGNQGELPKSFTTAPEILPIDRIKVQSKLQAYIDASISSTINLPNETTIDEVFDIYVEAWKHGLKGVTIWRDGCQREGILSTDDKKPEITPIQLENPHELKRGEIIKPGDHWLGLKRTLMTGCGTLHVTAYFDPETGDLRECYLSKGSTGGCNNFMVGLSRMISLSARGGISIEKILDQLKSCGVCPSYYGRTLTKKDTSKGSCCPVAVGNALRDMHKEIQEIICACKEESIASLELAINETFTETKKKTTLTPYKDPGWSTELFNSKECPQCHENTLIHQGGCINCVSCGWSRCT